MDTRRGFDANIDNIYSTSGENNSKNNYLVIFNYFVRVFQKPKNIY